MILAEIKKLLYKEKPEATFIHACRRKAGVFLLYGCSLGARVRGEEGFPNIIFEVPVDEIGDGIFPATIQAQLLIRYIVQPETAEP